MAFPFTEGSMSLGLANARPSLSRTVGRKKWRTTKKGRDLHTDWLYHNGGFFTDMSNNSITNVMGICRGINSFPQSAAASRHYQAQTGIMFLLGTAGVTLNALFLLTVAKERRVRTLPCKLYATVSITDLVLSGIGAPLYATKTYGMYNLTRHCWLEQSLAIIVPSTAVMGITTILAITLEQYAAIAHPYLHQKHVTYSRLLAGLIIVWLPMVTFNVMVVIFFPAHIITYRQTLAFGVLISLLFMTFCYIRMVIIVRNVTRKISKTNADEAQKIRQRAKIEKIGILIMAAAAICFTPLMTFIFHHLRTKQPIVVPLNLLQWKDLLPFTAAIWNPFVYYWRLRSIREATGRLLPDCAVQSTGIDSREMTTRYE